MCCVITSDGDPVFITLLLQYFPPAAPLNPFTPESDQSQISPPAPPEILHHTVRRTWLIIAGLFELSSERVDPFTPKFKKYILPTFLKWGYNENLPVLSSKFLFKNGSPDFLVIIAAANK